MAKSEINADTHTYYLAMAKSTVKQLKDRAREERNKELFEECDYVGDRFFWRGVASAFDDVLNVLEHSKFNS